MKKNDKIIELIADLKNLEAVNEKVTSLLNENLTWLKTTEATDIDNIAIIDGMLYNINFNIVLNKWKIEVEFTRISPLDNMEFTVVIRYKEPNNGGMFGVYPASATIAPDGLMEIFDMIKSEVASDPTEKEDEFI